MNYTNMGDTMWTSTVNNAVVPTLEDIKLAIAEMHAIMTEMEVRDPIIVKAMIETVFPYVVNAIVTYQEENDDE